ncbi:hypothetical protein D3C87_21080 [compost metagenome]
MGRRMLSYPVSISFVVIITSCILIFIYKILFWRIALLMIPVLVFLFQWIYRSYMLTKWKIRAYERTKDVKELKAQAILLGLISEQEGFLEKRLRTSEEKRKLEEFQKKSDNPGVFEDQPDVPKETVIDYSKRNHIAGTVFFTLGFIATLIMFWMKEQKYVLALLILSAYFIWRNVQGLFKNPPRIVLNEKGIETSDCGLVGWAFISDEKVVREDDDGESFYLVFNYPEGEEKISIGSLSRTPEEIHKLLKVYRGRFEK